MSRRAVVTTVLCFVILLMTLSLLADDTKPAFHQHTGDDYFTLSPAGMEKLDGLICWVQTQKGKAVIFSQDYKDDWNNPRRLFSTLLTAPQKASKTNALLTINKGRILAGTAVTYQNAEQISPTASAAIGLLLVVYNEDYRSDRIFVASVPFNAAGKKVGNFKIIKILETGTWEENFYNVSIYAAVQSNNVAITISATAREQTAEQKVAWSRCYFAETDLNGVKKYNPALVKLPDNGADYQFELLQPSWWQGKWFAASRAVQHNQSARASRVYDPSGSSLYLFSATPRKGLTPRMKMKLLEKDDQINTDCVYAGVQLLPTSQSSASPAVLDLDKLYLLYQKRKYQDATAVDPRQYSVEMFTRLVKKNGNAKKPKKLEIEVPAGLVPSSDIDYRSSQVLSGAVISGGGEILLELTRYYQTLYYNVGPSRMEVTGNHAVYRLNLQLMAMELIFDQMICMECYLDFLHYGQAIYFGGYFGYLYTAYEMGEDYAKALVVKMIGLDNLGN